MKLGFIFHLLNLRFADNDTELNWLRESGWCYTKYENDYTREVQNAHSKRKRHLNADNGKIIHFYIYTDQFETKRIAVSLDTDNGKHFTTADNACSAEKSSIKFVSILSIIYTSDKLIVNIVLINRGIKNRITGCKDGNYDVYYDNYYVKVPNGIRNAFVQRSTREGNLKWIAHYDSLHNDQHMIAVYPFGGPATDVFGFKNSGDYKNSISELSRGAPMHCRCEYDLTQEISYNNHPNEVCLTQMTFKTGNAWHFEDNNGMDQEPYMIDSEDIFDIYDFYGNYGKFNVDFVADNNRNIKIDNRN